MAENARWAAPIAIRLRDIPNVRFPHPQPTAYALHQCTERPDHIEDSRDAPLVE
jgi:hypothetical protein